MFERTRNEIKREGKGGGGDGKKYWEERGDDLVGRGEGRTAQKMKKRGKHSKAHKTREEKRKKEKKKKKRKTKKPDEVARMRLIRTVRDKRKREAHFPSSFPVHQTTRTTQTQEKQANTGDN